MHASCGQAGVPALNVPPPQARLTTCRATGSTARPAAMGRSSPPALNTAASHSSWCSTWPRGFRNHDGPASGQIRPQRRHRRACPDAHRRGEDALHVEGLTPEMEEAAVGAPGRALGRRRAARHQTGDMEPGGDPSGHRSVHHHPACAWAGVTRRTAAVIERARNSIPAAAPAIAAPDRVIRQLNDDGAHGLIDRPCATSSPPAGSWLLGSPRPRASCSSPAS